MRFFLFVFICNIIGDFYRLQSADQARGGKKCHDLSVVLIHFSADLAIKFNNNFAEESQVFEERDAEKKIDRKQVNVKGESGPNKNPTRVRCSE